MSVDQLYAALVMYVSLSHTHICMILKLVFFLIFMYTWVKLYMYMYMHVHKYIIERKYSAVIKSWAKQTKFLLNQTT